MAEVLLTQGKVALVDEDDLARLSAHRWWAYRCNSIRENWYAYTTIGRSTMFLHRFLVDPNRGLEVDHIDGDGLNNTRENLRVCTRAQNCANSRRRPNKSGFRGVYYHPGRQAPFRAVLWHHGEIGLGYFHTAEEAALARDRAAIEAFGPFAILNFPAGSPEHSHV